MRKSLNDSSISYLIKASHLRSRSFLVVTTQLTVRTKIPIDCLGFRGVEVYVSGLKVYWIYQKYDDRWLFTPDKPDKVTETTWTRGDIRIIEIHRSKAWVGTILNFFCRTRIAVLIWANPLNPRPFFARRSSLIQRHDKIPNSTSIQKKNGDG